MLNNKSILVTGGTGSFGKKFVETILDKFPDIKRLVIFSRDELKQFLMAQEFPDTKYRCIRYFLGDVRDAERFKRACQGIDYIVHAAALKQVPAAEYNPMEFIKTNILGAENVINAALDTDVKKVIALSTDKAAAPINLYGATKLCSDKLFIAANNIKGFKELSFSVVRYGNVLGSRGSVVPFFLNKRKDGVIPVTNPEMTRFNITLDQSVDMVLFALEKSIGGEIFIPKIPTYKITDIVEAIAPNCKTEIIGIRPGEKLHEEMITPGDSPSTIELENHYIILSQSSSEKIEKYIKHYNAKHVKHGFCYNSEDESNRLTVSQIRDLIKKNLDPNFSI